MMRGGSVGVVEVLVRLSTRGITATATVTAALETLETAAAAGHATATAPDNAPDDRQDYQATNDNNGNSRPSE